MIARISLDQLILFCYQYDSSKGRYAPVAMNIMRIGGAVSVVLLGLFLGIMWARERGRKQHLVVKGSEA